MPGIAVQPCEAHPADEPIPLAQMLRSVLDEGRKNEHAGKIANVEFDCTDNQGNRFLCQVTVHNGRIHHLSLKHHV